MHHVRAREPGNGVIFTQKNRLLGTDLFAHPAKNAADHVDIEFLWIFLDFGKAVSRRNLAWNNFDRARWTDEFAELASNTTHTTILIPHERGRAPVMVRQAGIPFLLRILHGDLGAAQQHVFKMLKRDGQAGGDGWEIQSLAPV